MNENSCDHPELIEYAVSQLNQVHRVSVGHCYRCAQCGEIADPDEKERTILNRPMRVTERTPT